jgi:hypothetical protein
MHGARAFALIYTVAVLPAFGLASSPHIKLQWTEIPTPIAEKSKFQIMLPNRFPEAGKEFFFSNETTRIRFAHLVDQTVVVLGSVGTSANIVSLFEAATGKEKLRFLCWNPELSPTGKYLAFKRFYPRFTDPEILTESVAILPIASVPAAPEGIAASGLPPMEVGRILYPPLRAAPPQAGEPNRLHLIHHNFVWLQSDQLLVLGDSILKNSIAGKPEQTQLVGIRIENGLPKSYELLPIPLDKVTPEMLPDASVRIRNLRSENGKVFADVEMTAPAAHTEATLVFSVDPLRFEKSVVTQDDRSGVSRRANIPWEMLESYLSEFVPPPRLKQSANAEDQRVTVYLETSPGGDVESARGILGPPELCGMAEATVQRWKFRPFLVSGIPLAVATTVDVSFRAERGKSSSALARNEETSVGRTGSSSPDTRASRVPGVMPTEKTEKK